MVGAQPRLGVSPRWERLCLKGSKLEKEPPLLKAA